MGVHPAHRGIAAFVLALCVGALVTACSDVPPGDALLEEPVPSSSFCLHIAIVYRAFEDVSDGTVERSTISELNLAAEGFAEDARWFAGRHGPNRAIALAMAEHAADLSEALQIDDDSFGRLSRAISTQLRSVERGFCQRTDDQFRWIVDDSATVELQIPESWRAFDRPWEVGPENRPGTGLIAGESYTPLWAGSPWLLPNVFFAASPGLAEHLGIKGVRLALALDRLEAWMETDRVALRDCREFQVAPYEKSGSALWGFVRRGEDCGGLGATLIELYTVALPRERTTYVALFRLRLRRPGDHSYLPRLEGSYHLVH